MEYDVQLAGLDEDKMVLDALICGVQGDLC